MSINNQLYDIDIVIFLKWIEYFNIRKLTIFTND